jgi:hypothetical protein
MTIEGYDGERVLVSYDVAGSARSVAARVCQIVFGRSATPKAKSGIRRAEGFIWRPGVVWIGQSVLIMPPPDAAELTERLRRLGVRVTHAPISIGHDSLRAFRRPPKAGA